MTAQSKNPDPFCSDLSCEAGETMIGTAPTSKTWFLLEYNNTWHRKATEQNDLPRPIQKWLSAQLALIPNSRLLFIKQQRPDGAAGLTFFVVLSRETSPRLYRFSLDDYDALLKLDLATLLAGDPAGDPFRHSEPLFLVCTNGRRDRCCARKGPALYQAVANVAGDKAWQCTHLGGHRFAPTLVTLPDGAFYGRLEPAEAKSLVRSSEQGDLLLEKLRGRCIYDPLSQAAEQFLRQETGVRQRNALIWQKTEALDEGRWAVTFRGPGSRSQRVTLIQEAPVECLVSCNPLKMKAVAHFRLEGVLELSDQAPAGSAP